MGFRLSEIASSANNSLEMIQASIVAIAFCRLLGDGLSKLTLFVKQQLSGIVVEKTDVAASLFKLLDSSPPRFRAFMDTDRNCGIDLRTGYLLKQFGTLALGGEKKGIEFALGEKHRSPKLIECEVSSRFYSFPNLGLSRRHGAAVVKAKQRTLFVLEPPICAAAGAIGFPANTVALAILSDEIDLRITAAGPTAEDRAAIMNGDRLPAGIGSVFPTAYRDTGIFAVERKTQRIKNGRLASTRLACDGE